MATDDYNVSLGVELVSVRRGMAEVRRITETTTEKMVRDFRDVDQQAARTGRSINRVSKESSIASGAFKELARYVGLTSVVIGTLRTALGGIRMADEVTLIRSRMQNLTQDTQATNAMLAETFAISQRMQTSFATVADSAAKILPTVQAMGGGVNEATQLSEILAATARISGQSAEESAAAMRQFVQALGSGVLQGEELKSILENNQELARRLAAALGVGVGELKALGAEGKLTSEIVANAMLKDYDEIRRVAMTVADTTSGVFQTLANSVTLLSSELDSASGFTGFLIRMMKGLVLVVDYVTAGMRTARTASVELTETDVAGWGTTIIKVFAKVFDVASVFTLAIQTIATQVVDFGVAIKDALTLNFSGAKDQMKELVATTVAAGNELRRRITDDVFGDSGVYNRIVKFSTEQDAITPAIKLNPLAKSKSELTDKEIRAAETASKQLQAIINRTYQAELKEMRRSQAQYQNNMQARSQLAQAEADRALAIFGAQSSEYQSAQNNLLRIKTAVERQIQQVEAITFQSAMDGARAVVDTRAQQTQRELALGMISNEQAIQQEIAHEQRRYQILRDAMEQRLALMQASPDRDPVAIANQLETIENIERDYLVRRNALTTDLLAESARYSSDFYAQVESGAAQMFESLGDGTLKFRDLWSTVWDGLGRITLSVISKMLAEQLVAMIRGQAMAIQEAFAKIKAHAAVAGAGAYAATAAIPFVGPALAPAAGATAFTGAMGFGAALAVPSAAAGYDIPLNTNPLTQLHEKEMTLPRKQAEVVRKMARDGDSAQRPPVNLNFSWAVQALDAGGLSAALDANRDEFVEKMREMVRDVGLEPRR